MAKFKVVISGGNVIVQSYHIEDSVLDDDSLKIKIFKEYTKEWAEFILVNRNNNSEVPAHDYDIVYGPIANDKVGMQIRKYKDGTINFEEFLHRLQYMKGITFQYFFGTDKAIKKLRKL